MRNVRSILLLLGCILALVACGRGAEDESLGTAASALAPAGYLDVTTVGAIGDGATDDTGALASAALSLSSLCPSQGICGLYFPTGTYLSNTLTLPANMRMTGSGVLLGKPGGTGPVLVLSAGDAISGLGINGNSSVRTAGTACVFAKFAEGVSLSSVSVYNCVTNGVEIDNTTNYTVSSCDIYNCDQQSCNPNTGADCFAGINLGFSGVAQVLNGGQILNNTVSSCSEGIEWWGGDSATTSSAGISNLTISNNTVTNIGTTTATGNMGGGCIWGSDGSGVTVSGNTVNGCADVGIDLEGTSNSTVTGNSVANANNGGITTFYGSSNVTISNNFVNQTANPGPGIHFYGTDLSSSITVSENTIDTSSGWGISMESNVINGLTISGNTITVGGSIGDIEVIGAPGQVLIENNTLTVAGPLAISVQGSPDVVETNNTIHSTAPAVTSVYGLNGSTWTYAQAWPDNYISIYGSGFESCAQGFNCGNVIALYGFNTSTGQTQYNYFQNDTGTYGAVTYESAGQINMLLPSYIQGSVDVAVYNGATATWSPLPGWPITIN